MGKAFGRITSAVTVLMSSSLLLAGAVLYTSTAAQPSGGSIPEAPAGGLDPSKLPDIEGIHLGMTPDQVIPKIKALPSSASVQVTPGRYDTVSSVQWPVYVTASSGINNADSLMATFSSPPNRQALVQLQRQNTFAPGKQPTAETVKAALFQKYGPNATEVRPNIWVWTFNEMGGPMASPPPARQLLDCDPILSPKSNIKSYLSSPLAMNQQNLKQWLTLHCNSYGVYVKATFFGSSLNVVIDDTAEDMRDVVAGQEYIEQSNTAKQQHLQQDTQKNVPSL
jgi:hypothetical protein